MSNHFNAFEMSPVPPPGPDAQPPEPFHGIYGMPMFVTLACRDLDASTQFWIDTLGFFELFGVPGRLVHLRRWAFQDVLLVPAEEAEPATGAQPLVSFACVEGELDGIVAACGAASAPVDGPRDTPWNTRDVQVTTPEGSRVVFTAAKAWDEGSTQAQNLKEVGIRPESPEEAR